jgi:hypothetical protein
MACQVLRCSRPGSPVAVPEGMAGPTGTKSVDGMAAWALCDGHRSAIAGGAPWAVHTPGSLLVGPDAQYDLPRVVKRLRARAADTVQVVGGRPRELVHLDLTIGLEGSTEHDRDLQLVLPGHAARALGCGLLELADEVDGAGLGAQDEGM